MGPKAVDAKLLPQLDIAGRTIGTLDSAVDPSPVSGSFGALEVTVAGRSSLESGLAGLLSNG